MAPKVVTTRRRFLGLTLATGALAALDTGAYARRYWPGYSVARDGALPVSWHAQQEQWAVTEMVEGSDYRLYESASGVIYRVPSLAGLRAMKGDLQYQRDVFLFNWPGPIGHGEPKTAQEYIETLFRIDEARQALREGHTCSVEELNRILGL